MATDAVKIPVLLVEDNENNHHHDVHSDEKPHDKK